MTNATEKPVKFYAVMVPRPVGYREAAACDTMQEAGEYRDSHGSRSEVWAYFTDGSNKRVA